MNVTPFLEWLLDLENIRLARDAPLLLRWENQLPAWLLFGIAVLAFVWIAGIYQRESLSVRRRSTLGLVRAVLMAFLLAVLCQPAIVLQRNRIEPAQTVFLLDTSLSMAAVEPLDQDRTLAESMSRSSGIADPVQLAKTSRLGFVQAALLRDDAATLKLLFAKNALQFTTFDTGVRTLVSVSPSDPIGSLPSVIAQVRADGLSSDLASAIRRIIEKSHGRRIAAIVVASDGQSTEPGSWKDVTDLARGRQTPIYTTRIGLNERPVDIEVGNIRTQESVFANDLLSVEGEVRAFGTSSPVTVRVELIDERTGFVATSEEVTLDPGTPKKNVELRTKPTGAGRIAFRFQAVPLSGERVTENNGESVLVQVMADKLRVLYVEGYPRFEYRYLKNAFLREKSIELSVLLLEADEQFVQEGTFPIRRFPESPEELGRFDVVLFGDVDPRAGWLTSAQMKMLLDFVGNDGGGFGLIAGERFAPQRFLGTPLEKLVAVRIDPTFLGPYDISISNGFPVQLTPEGKRSRLFGEAGHSSGEQAGRISGTEASLPELFWYARTLGAKPGATVLAEHPNMQTQGDAARGPSPMPLVVVGRYGAGKIFFQGTDDTWRWRQHTGELMHDTYWVQATREIMRSGRVAQDRRLTIRTDRKVYDFGQRVQIQIEILDSELLAANRDPVPLVVMQEGKEISASGRTIGGTLAKRLLATKLGPDSSLYEVNFTPENAGRFRVQVDSIAPREGEAPASHGFRVEKPDLEMRRPEADHESLRRIAEATGGRFLELSDWPQAFAEIPDRSVLIPDDVTEPLWDSKLALILFVLLLGTEWVLRKAFGVL